MEAGWPGYGVVCYSAREESQNTENDGILQKIVAWNTLGKLPGLQRLAS